MSKRALLMAWCFIAGSGCFCGPSTGDACSAAAPCPYGHDTCDTTFPGGYCTRSCNASTPGALCAIDADQLDGACGLALADGGLGCAQSCTPGVDAGFTSCRAGYRCVPAGDAGASICTP